MITKSNILDARILIIDDKEINISLLEGMLSEAGYTSILGLTDPRETFDFYESFCPDLILLDINMPHLNGYQVMEKLQILAQDDYVPILVLTGQDDDETRIRSLTLGAKDFLLKPFDQLEALTRIKNMLEVRLLHNKIKEQNEVLELKVVERTLELQGTSDELEKTRLDIIRRLGMAAEHRDQQTGAHILRMSYMCYELAKSIGWNESKLNLILHASPMHDLGKIGIPDNILLKAGKLNESEWKTMKKHPSLGGKMLEGDNSSLITMARTIALTHHEHWDGKGYPLGLKGKEIPLEGRICAIADVFDALTSERPYKEAWTVKEALQEIIEGSGTQFDPELVNQMTKIGDKFREIKSKFQE